LSQSPKSGQFNSDIKHECGHAVDCLKKSQSPKSGQFNSDQTCSSCGHLKQNEVSIP